METPVHLVSIGLFGRECLGPFPEFRIRFGFARDGVASNCTGRNCADHEVGIDPWKYIVYGNVSSDQCVFLDLATLDWEQGVAAMACRCSFGLDFVGDHAEPGRKGDEGFFPFRAHVHSGDVVGAE